jgi:hypothetical protein
MMMVRRMLQWKYIQPIFWLLGAFLFWQRLDGTERVAWLHVFLILGLGWCGIAALVAFAILLGNSLGQYDPIEWQQRNLPSRADSAMAVRRSAGH